MATAPNTGSPSREGISLLAVAEDTSLGADLSSALSRRGVPVAEQTVPPDLTAPETGVRQLLFGDSLVLALCSRESLRNPAFLDMAKYAGGHIVPVLLTGVRSLPGEFGNAQPFDLSGWRGDPTDARLDSLAHTLTLRLDERAASSAAAQDVAGAGSRYQEESGFQEESGYQETPASAAGEPASAANEPVPAADEPVSAADEAAAEAPQPAPAPSADGLPETDEDIRDLLMRAVQLVDLTEFTGTVGFSDAARDVLRQSRRSSADATAVLLIALTSARDRPSSNVSGALRAQLAGQVPGDIVALLRDLANGLPARSSPPADDPPAALVTLLADALRYAQAVSGRPEVHTRHLLAAAALASEPPVSGAVLDALHVSRSGLCGLLFGVIGQFQGVGRIRAWRDLLLGGLTGGISTDRVDPNKGIPRDLDALDFSVWTAMFADVIADRNTDANLPLSIGLFGAWGAGKSYFMGLLRSEIDSRCGSPGYVRDVVHIGFNAWHYADTNLWASLGDEIFRKLMAELPSKAGEQEKELREQIAGGLVAAEELRVRQEQAAAETERYAREADRARAARQAGTRELLAAMAGSAELRGYLNKAWRFLGVSDQAEQADLLARQLDGERQDAIVLRRLLGKRGTVLIAAVCLVALLVTIAGAVIPAGWGARLFGAGGLTTVALVLGWAVTLARRVNGGLAALRTAAVKAASEHDTAIRDAERDLRKAQADEKAASEHLDHAAAHVAELQRRLSALDPAQQAYAFLAERAASRDYAGQLGLVSTIRKDFQHLVTVLKSSQGTVGTAAAAAPETSPGTEPPAAAHAIDRIILYIDDLDRCRPRQVVEVLQAVHLLLALDLFVVVVGVDPRWLLRSLRDQYPGLLDAAAQQPLPRGDTPSDASTADYLEKIFNIPFVLPDFPADRLGQLLRGMNRTVPVSAEPGRPADAAPEPGPDGSGDAARAGGAADAAGGDGGPAVSGSSAGGGGAAGDGDGDGLGAGQDAAGRGTAAGPPAEAGRAALLAPPEPLTEPEIKFLAELGPFISTPRDAKRLFNLYRMLRFSRRLSPASAFLGDDDEPGDYQAVAVLLAMLTADPRLLRHVLDAPGQPASRTADDSPVTGGLMVQPDEAGWQHFAASLDPQRSGEGWRNGVIGPIPDTELAAWQRLADATIETSDLVELMDLSAFRRWAPHVRRFSYFLLTGETG